MNMLNTLLVGVLLSVPSFVLPQASVLHDPDEPQSVVWFDKSTRRGWLGVSVQDLTPRLAKANGNKVTEGALVNDVERKSPADSAGIEEGDVIVEFDGRKVYGADDLRKFVGRTKPGTTVTIIVDRKGTTKTLKATIGKYPARRARAFSFRGPGSRVITIGTSKVLGAELRPLGKQLAEYFQVPDGKGVLVESVEKESAAEKAGLKAGDVIIKIGNERVRDVNDVWEILEDYDEGEKVEVEVIRKGASKIITMEIEEGEESSFYEFRMEPRMPFFRDLEREIRLNIKPRIELDEIRPDLEELKDEMQRLKDELRFRHLPDVKIRVEKNLRSTI